jgi:hypothetical protein
MRKMAVQVSVSCRPYFLLPHENFELMEWLGLYNLLPKEIICGAGMQFSSLALSVVMVQSCT